MESSTPELTLELDWEFIDACNGFSFDMGGSVMKLAFVDKDDWIDPKNRNKGSQGQIRLVNFHRNKLDEACEFIKKRVHITRTNDEDIPDIYSTGFGGSQFGGKIKEKIRIKNNQLMEMECFNESLMHLITNLPRKQALHPVYKQAFEVVSKHEDFTNKLRDNLKDKSQIFDVEKDKDADNKGPRYKQLVMGNEDNPLAEIDDLFPCGLMMCGSASAFSVINEDGTSRPVDLSNRGGKTFMAYGSLIAGAKNYSELMELCVRGSSNNLDDTLESLSKETKISTAGEDDVYGTMGNMLDNSDVQDVLLFSFGKGEGKSKDDFKKEDLARCVLETHASDVVHTAAINAKLKGVKHVIFCGGFVNHPLAREVITYKWLHKLLQFRFYEPQNNDEIQIHFLVHAQSLGAIGALMNHHLLWSEKNKVHQEAKT